MRTARGWLDSTTRMRRRPGKVGALDLSGITGIDSARSGPMNTGMRRRCFRIFGPKSKRCSGKEECCHDDAAGRDREFRRIQEAYAGDRARRNEAGAGGSEGVVHIHRKFRQGAFGAQPPTARRHRSLEASIAQRSGGKNRPGQIQPLAHAQEDGTIRTRSLRTRQGPHADAAYTLYQCRAGCIIARVGFGEEKRVADGTQRIQVTTTYLNRSSSCSTTALKGGKSRCTVTHKRWLATSS